MPTGEIIDWNDATGRGTIARDNANGELALHRSQCIGLAIKKGARVSFSIAAAPKTGRPMATNVRMASERTSRTPGALDRLSGETR